MKPGGESPPFPPPSVTQKLPPGTLASLTNGRRIWKNCFAGQGESMIGHKHAAIVVCTVELCMAGTSARFLSTLSASNPRTLLVSIAFG